MDADKILTLLKACPVAQKAIYGWPFADGSPALEALGWKPPAERLSDDVWREIIRIGWTVNVRLGHLADAERFLKLAGSNGATRLGVNLSPWCGERQVGSPATWTRQDDDDLYGTWQQQANEMKALAKRFGAGIGAFLIDMEGQRWNARRGTAGISGMEITGALSDEDMEWNAGLTMRQKRLYDLCKSVEPTADVSFFNMGSAWVNPYDGDTHWDWSPYTGWGKCDHWSATLYRPHRFDLTRREFEATLDEAERYGVKEVVPWLALCSVYAEQPRSAWWTAGQQLKALGHILHPSVMNAWMIGRMLRSPAVPFIVLYPMVGYTDEAIVRLVALVRGLNGVQDIMDIIDE